MVLNVVQSMSEFALLKEGYQVDGVMVEEVQVQLVWNLVQALVQSIR